MQYVEHAGGSQADTVFVVSPEVLSATPDVYPNLQPCANGTPAGADPGSGQGSRAGQPEGQV